MSIKKSFGGDRIGSGNKMDIHLHNFERSNHDLSNTFKSSMAPGTLVPCYKKVILPGDTWEIDLDAEVLTLPALGPLFASAKLQIDAYTFPVRLYQAQLHNNKKKIGLKMSDIKLPLFELWAHPTDMTEVVDIDNYQINPSHVLKYLGISGIAVVPSTEETSYRRFFNAVPLLGLIDIYANYYANKQEGIGAMIHTEPSPIIDTVDTVDIEFDGSTDVIPEVPAAPAAISTNNGSTININFTGSTPIPSQIYFITSQGRIAATELAIGNYVEIIAGTLSANYDYEKWGTITIQQWRMARNYEIPMLEPRVTTFPLENCDTIREELLEKATVGANPVILNGVGSGLMIPPISNILFQDTILQINSLVCTQDGLFLKTYQSDMLNNWMDTEWIDGPGGINAMTMVSTAGDAFTIDALILANKIYDMMNRVAVSGGSYYDWVEVTYGQDTFYQCETPVYEGGLSKEIIFQEVVSNSQSSTNTGTQPLGTLASRGKLSSKHKGGKINIKCHEPGYLMIIVSITPRIDYSQGSDFDNDLLTMDDFHKPGLDAIGFQDLPAERAAWWDSYVNGGTLIQKSIGKQVAWQEYMTSINKVYGNFAIGAPVGEMFMTFNRRYEYDAGSNGIADITTYIDPAKFNYIFAQTSRDAQNFWVQVAINATARRKMSAKVIPNL